MLCKLGDLHEVREEMCISSSIVRFQFEDDQQCGSKASKFRGDICGWKLEVERIVESMVKVWGLIVPFILACLVHNSANAKTFRP